jgi:lipoprotein-anchoring transpeptidase ErfK/SrfK
MLRMRPLLGLPLLVFAIALFSLASARAEPQTAPEPNSAAAPSAPPPAGDQSNQAAEQPEAGPHATQPDSAPAGENAPKDATTESPPKDATTEPQSKEGKTEEGAASQEPASKILINIDKSTQQMTVFVDGIERYSWPVSTGKRGYSTPSGNYTATSMNEVWYSKEWDNAPMPHAIFFMKDGHAIHGSYEVKTLGKPVSHGCVRISPANAKVLFALVKEKGMKNTEVVLAGTTPGGEAKVASEPDYPRDGGGADWFPPGRDYYPPPRRRGLFGGFFQPRYYGPQGYYRPPRGYYRDY